jgi:uncharacterized membrane protein
MGRSFTLADVLGIVAIILAIVGLIFAGLDGIVLGIIAIVLALIGMHGISGEKKNIFCVIGLILGIVCLIVGIAVVILHLTHVPPGQARK